MSGRAVVAIDVPATDEVKLSTDGGKTGDMISTPQKRPEGIGKMPVVWYRS